MIARLLCWLIGHRYETSECMGMSLGAVCQRCGAYDGDYS